MSYAFLDFVKRNAIVMYFCLMHISFNTKDVLFILLALKKGKGY